MEERSDQLNANQKEALLEKFKLDQVTSCSSSMPFRYEGRAGNAWPPMNAASLQPFVLRIGRFFAQGIQRSAEPLRSACAPSFQLSDLMKAAELGALKAEEQSSKSKLEQKLAARRQKKTEEMRRREERQLKEKEAKDAQRLQV